MALLKPVSLTYETVNFCGAQQVNPVSHSVQRKGQMTPKTTSYVTNTEDLCQPARAFKVIFRSLNLQQLKHREKSRRTQPCCPNGLETP